MKLRQTSVLIILIVNLSGCVGAYFSKSNLSEKHEIKNDGMEYFNIERAKNDHPINGAQTYNNEIEWCGLTIWAIIPIPLLLPVCSSYTEVTFLNGKPVLKQQNTLKGQVICVAHQWLW